MLDAVFRYMAMDRRAYLIGRRHVRRLLLRAALSFVVLVGCAGYAAHRLGDGGSFVPDVLLGALMGAAGSRAALTTLRTAHAFRDGWLEGRLLFVEALAQGAREGTPIDEVLMAQLVIDESMLF